MPDPVTFSILAGMSITLLLCAAVGCRRGQFFPSGNLKRSERPAVFWGSIACQAATGIGALVYAVSNLLT
jgi:hypothetical protein